MQRARKNNPTAQVSKQLRLMSPDEDEEEYEQQDTIVPERIPAKDEDDQDLDGGEVDDDEIDMVIDNAEASHAES